MTLSNNPGAVARSWRNYRMLLENFDVKAAAAEWCVRYAEAYRKAFEGRQLGMYRGAMSRDGSRGAAG